MILVVAPRDDLHARVVRERVMDLGVDCTIWNTTWFPWRQRLTWTPKGDVLCSGDVEFGAAEIGCIWWRRYRRPTVNPVVSDPHVKRFCAGEAAEMVRGIAEATEIPVINSLSAERRASAKLLQLQTATAVGFAIPRTIVSNDRDELLAFVDASDRVVIKPLLCDYPHSIPTRECTRRDFFDDDATRLAPTLLQNFVPCAVDIRVCVIGETAFSAELRRDNAATEPDWRLTATGWRSHELPGAIAASTLSLVRRLGLHTASLDLRLTPDGEYVFFEINPSGQFLFLEVDSDLRITEELARLLVGIHNDPRSHVADCQRARGHRIPTPVGGGGHV